MTIFAARRVVPPDLIEPATESAPRMNETGPDAKPPPERFSFCDRIRETFTPDPDPPLKMIPSSRNQSRIECMSSSTERMKHRALLGDPADADVEPHRRVERRVLVDHEVLELVREGVAVGRAREVAA